MPTVNGERSILDDHGRVLFYGIDHFLREIVEGDLCFICGVGRGTSPFNDEHVIPDWILRKYALHDKQITLPNGSHLPYGQYKVQCCARCNSRMGEVFEDPISELTSKGHAAVTQHLQNHGPWLLFSWLNLIFLKTHLKDRTLLINRDRRVQSGLLSELIEWPEMHHIHCIARSFFTGVSLSPQALGSVFVMPAKTGTPLGDFDYGDYYPGRALLLRLGETAFICVLNDSCGALMLLQEYIQRIDGPLGPLQCRELLAHAAYANMLIENRPMFHTSLDSSEGTITISADVAKAVHAKERIPSEFGEILYSLLSSAIPAIPFPNPEEVTEHIRQGRWSFLFDGEGHFID
jgi:hypothetical protein